MNKPSFRRIRKARTNHGRTSHVTCRKEKLPYRREEKDDDIHDDSIRKCCSSNKVQLWLSLLVVSREQPSRNKRGHRRVLETYIITGKNASLVHKRILETTISIRKGFSLVAVDRYVYMMKKWCVHTYIVLTYLHTARCADKCHVWPTQERTDFFRLGVIGYRFSANFLR